MTAPRKQPTDHLKAIEADAVEIDGPVLVTVEYHGEILSFSPSPLDWTCDTMLAFEESKAVSALKGLLGPDYARHGIGSWTMRQTQGLFELVAEKAGLGNSGN